MAAKLRLQTCSTCTGIARISVFGTAPAAHNFVPEITLKTPADSQPFRCYTCTSGSPHIDYSAAHTYIPADLSSCVYLSFKAQRWVAVNCEQLLRTHVKGRLDEFAVQVQGRLEYNGLLTTGLVRHILCKYI